MLVSVRCPSVGKKTTCLKRGGGAVIFKLTKLHIFFIREHLSQAILEKKFSYVFEVFFQSPFLEVK